MRTLAVLLIVVSSPLFGLQTMGEEISFNRDIRPILSDNCYYCHGFDEGHREAGLRLDEAESAQDVLAAGNPDDSELLRRIVSEDEDELMPPPDSHKSKLTTDQVELIRRWIQQGAVYEAHWAFVKPTKPAVESQDNGEELTTSDVIDHFVGKRLKQQGLEFAKPAIATKWFRRMKLDLTGIPPTLAELDAFTKSAKTEGEAAYERAVDETLRSPHYGERMALEWLDVARYADTHGFQEDAYRMNWPWRDWVIRSFNENMPYDQFTIEQLAGDLLEKPTQDQMIATAFNRNHMINGEGGAIRAENLAKTAFDRIETTGTTWMGLTVGCCQCHDHKFDPLKQTDYYSFYAFFNQVDERAGNHKKFSVKTEGQRYSKTYMVDKPYIEVANKKQAKKLKELRGKVDAAAKRIDESRQEFTPEFLKWIKRMIADPELADKTIKNKYWRRFVTLAPIDNPKDAKTKGLTEYFLENDKRWSRLISNRKDAERVLAKFQGEVPLVMVMRDDEPRETYVLKRGNYESPGEKVTAGVPDFLPPLPGDPAKANRLSLAQWLVSPEHPLTSRVTINRYWQLFFGRGLVSTPDDFGLQGALPTHPDLLDWLAVDFRENGWDIKRLVKSFMLSRTYRQSAAVSPAVIEQDPENKWYSRGSRQRLDSRFLRDQALAVSGLLVRDMGGPPVAPYQPGGIWEEMSLQKNHYMRESGDALYRRSLYTVWRRVVAPANFFDVPSRQTCSVSVQRTSTPLHALTLLNDTTYIEAARVWADRLTLLPDDATRIQRMFYAVTAREMGAEELKTVIHTLKQAREHFAEHEEEAKQYISMGEAPSYSNTPVPEHAAWTTVCLMILNLDEAISK